MDGWLDDRRAVRRLQRRPDVAFNRGAWPYRLAPVTQLLDHGLDRPPLGLALLGSPQLGAERLQPGDRLLLHTDGVTEARNSAGEFFGTHRLVEFTSRQAAAGRPAAETLRRLNHAILDYQDGALQDDATTVMIDWLTDQPQRTTPADAGDQAGPDSVLGSGRAVAR